MSQKCLRFGDENPNCSRKDSPDAIVLDPAIIKSGKPITLCKKLREAGLGDGDVITLCPGCNLNKYDLPTYTSIAISVKNATGKVCKKPKVLQATLCDKQQKQ